VFDTDGQKNKSKPSDANDDAQYPPVSVRISWARLLKRVFDIDMEHCPHCGGTLKIIAPSWNSARLPRFLIISAYLLERRRVRLQEALISSSLFDCKLPPVIFNFKFFFAVSQHSFLSNMYALAG